jgi:transcriptional regulator with XRE-family HTH domain
MPPRERAVDLGTRIARQDLARVSGDIRQARVMAGLALRDVGRAASLSAAQVSRIERGLAPSATIEQLARIGSTVGLRVRLRAYPGDDPIRDIAQVRLLERCRKRLHADLTVRTEVPLPIVGDLRAWDAFIERLRPTKDSGASLPVEAETRIADYQAQSRRLALKMRDGGVAHVLLVVSNTRANRAAVSAVGDALRELFPIPARQALYALAAGVHPGGSSLVFL